MRGYCMDGYLRSALSLALCVLFWHRATPGQRLSLCLSFSLFLFLSSVVSSPFPYSSHSSSPSSTSSVSPSSSSNPSLAFSSFSLSLSVTVCLFISLSLPSFLSHPPSLSFTLPFAVVSNTRMPGCHHLTPCPEVRGSWLTRVSLMEGILRGNYYQQDSL